MAACIAAITVFGICHGYANGLEMPANAGGLAFALGFVLATLLLHIGGILLGYLLDRMGNRRGEVIVRCAGAVAAAAGVGLIVGLQ